ncbi:hypothetical protein [Williamwhitmania taraxaci]|uniref:Uncharacterized protein n=1 Tax=Williamwhitmania taraxaci TaxID=1640674 RepID=A0A1G6S345_9BACT|nr:hypothetical protein [Williamwhitmania taraxaci]SDD10577.1 hypothetical protein SAMN05216323_10854 [Williamwhitmania taraxaci]
MVIENGKQTVQFKGQRILYAILLGIMVVLLFYLFPEETPVFGISKWAVVGIPVIVYILFIIYHFIINSSYVYFSNEKGILVFRFFSMRLLGESRKSIEIPADQLGAFSIEKGFFGRRIDLTLFKRVGRGNAKYPPFSISLLPRKERDKLIHVLNSLVSVEK